MTSLIIIFSLILFVVVLIQLAKMTDLTARIRGEALVEQQSNDRNAWYNLIFMVVFLVLSIYSAWEYKNYMLGYGPHEAASVHGKSLDHMFDVTLFFTGIVFVVTQIFLFWFAFKYRKQEGRKSLFLSHNNKLEVIWTAIPAVVMTFLVVGGLEAWNSAMADVKPGEDYLEIEATGYQFAWDIRYPGNDGVLGTKDFRSISANNSLGQIWTDKKNLDDFIADKIVIPVGKKVRVRINAKDVLHNFYLPHFRVKMDAVPGIPTYFVFTPTKTTREYRNELSKYPEYQVPFDPADPEGPKRWEKFEYELACAELCGKGHYSMRKVVDIVTPEEYKKWLETQKPTFDALRGTDQDPFKGKSSFQESLEKSLKSAEKGKAIELENVEFETGLATLTASSKLILDKAVEVISKFPTAQLEIDGHTDNTGDPIANKKLSQERASSVVEYFVSKGLNKANFKSVGFGQEKPIAPNDTPDNKQRNRRTEIKLI
jgi:cytochrome c oxidase subunit II